MITLRAKRRVWKQINKAASTLVNEYKIVFNDDCIYIKSVDPAHISMVAITVPRSAMSFYRDDSADTNEFVNIGLDSKRVALVLNNAMPDEEIKMSFNGRRAVFEGVMVGGQPFKYTTNALSVEGMANPKVPNLALPCTFVATIAHMRNAMKIAEKISDHVAIEANEGVVSLKVMGDTEEAEIIIGTCDVVDKKYRSLFPTDYYVNMFKYLQDVDSVRIVIGADLPTKVSAVTIDGVKIDFLLAPRIKNS